MSIAATGQIGTSQALFHRWDVTESIRFLMIANRSASSTTLKVWFVPANSTPSDDNLVLPDIALRGNSIIIVEWNDLRMGKDEAIWAQAAAATVTMQAHSDP